MDNKLSEVNIDMALARRAAAGNVLIFSDGGLRRAGMVASSAWIAYLIEGASATRMAHQSPDLQNAASAFQAEVIGLDLALNFLEIITTKQGRALEDALQHFSLTS